MKFPLLEPLRRNGQRLKPGGTVELDPKTDMAEIIDLVCLGVIRDVRPTAGKVATNEQDKDQGAGSGSAPAGAGDAESGLPGGQDVAALAGQVGSGESADTSADTQGQASAGQTPVAQAAADSAGATAPGKAAAKSVAKAAAKPATKAARRARG